MPVTSVERPDDLTAEWLTAALGTGQVERFASERIGTGQMSLYLARADRVVIGADLTRASLKLGAAAASRFQVNRVQFVETDLLRAGLRKGAFDVVRAP